mgnify:CR=1 FL=1
MATLESARQAWKLFGQAVSETDTSSASRTAVLQLAAFAVMSDDEEMSAIGSEILSLLDTDEISAAPDADPLTGVRF